MVLGTNLFKSILPEISGTIVALMDTGGTSPEPVEIRNPTIQILVRADKGEYEQAYNKIETISELLHGLSNITINNTNYINVWKLTEILSLGTDQKGRPVLSCNFRIKRS